jgi:hypothetical protein
MPIERRVNIVKALSYVYLQGKKMANNFVTKNVKKLKFQENFFPWRLQTRKETASVSTIKKFQ